MLCRNEFPDISLSIMVLLESPLNLLFKRVYPYHQPVSFQVPWANVSSRIRQPSANTKFIPFPV